MTAEETPAQDPPAEENPPKTDPYAEIIDKPTEVNATRNFDFKELSERELRSIFVAKCEDSNIACSEKLFNRFLTNQRKHPAKKVMSMEGIGLGPKACNVAVQVFYRHPNLKVLNLSTNSLKNDGALCIADLIFASSDLISVDISSNSIGDVGLSAIFQAMRTNRSIYHLHVGSNTGVSRNSVGNKAVEQLSLMLAENKVLSELNLCMSELTTDHIIRACQGLQLNHTLHSLNVSNNNLRSKGVVAILHALSDTSVTELNIANNYVTDDFGPHLAGFLETNTVLKRLDLSGNNLGHKFTSSISKTLGQQKTLRRLSLSRNPLLARGVDQLGPAIAKNKSLRVLDLSCCRVEMGGFKTFFQGLGKNESLRKLDLRHNTVADEGAILLADALREHPELQDLNLETCEVSDAGADAIMNAIRHTKVERVSFRNNLIHSGVSVEKPLSENPNILFMDVEFNDIDYKTYKDIQQIVKSNNRQRAEAKRQKLRSERQAELEQQQELHRVRAQVKDQRHQISLLQVQREEAKQHLVDAEKEKCVRIEKLESDQKNLVDRVSGQMEEMRSQRNELALNVQKAEAEVANLSNKLAREQETFKVLCRDHANCEQKIQGTKTQSVAELNDLKTRLESVKLKYKDAVEAVTTAWKMARDAARLKQEEEEARQRETEEAQTENTKPKKGKKGRSRSPSKRSQKSTKKQRSPSEGRKSSRSRASEASKRSVSAASKQSDKQATFETAPDEVVTTTE